jgi:hypothetical protein
MINRSNHIPRVTDMKPNPNVLFKRLGDEMVLFHLDSDHFYELNGTAARFWELLHEAGDADQARERMLGEFAVDPAQLAGEVDAFLASLRKENLVSLDE